MPWSNDVLTRVITGTYVGPNGAPAKGRVTFKPAVQVFDQTDAIIIQDAIVATLDSTGSFTVELPTTDNPTLRPNNWAYEVNVKLYGVKPRKFYARVPFGDGQTVDFLDAANAATSRSSSFSTQTTSTTLQGPVGPRGPGLISGEGPPTSSVGLDGDTYIDVLTGAYYGPKVDGQWPSTPFYSPGVTLRHVHTQSTAAETWSISHSLGGRPSVSVVDSSGTVVVGEVTYNSDELVTISFTAPFSGYAYLT